MTSSNRTARPRGKFLLAAGAAVCALALAACSSSGSSSPATASSGKVTLTFWSWVPGISQSVNLWNKTHPDIHVNLNEVTSVGAGTYAKMFSALQAGNAPDLGQIEYATLPNFEHVGGLDNLASYGAASVKADFVPWTWEQVTQGSAVYALYAGVGAVCATLLASAAGYALAKYEFRGRELVFSVILGGVLVPGTALALPLYLLLSKVSLTNTYWSVFLPSIVSPFGVYLARVYAAAAIPDELIEAGRIDGASEGKIFRSVALRIMSPALVTMFLFQFVAIWNNFLLPLVMLSNTRLYPVTLGLYTWNNQYGQAPQLVSYVVIGSLISVIPLVIAFLSLQRFWRSRLTAGSVRL